VQAYWTHRAEDIVAAGHQREDQGIHGAYAVNPPRARHPDLIADYVPGYGTGDHGRRARRD
jgi:hypothetical protein